MCIIDAQQPVFYYYYQGINEKPNLHKLIKLWEQLPLNFMYKQINNLIKINNNKHYLIL